ncbi:hypothetical protein [Ureibacillus aquaedulcis]|uniref:Uncharacterized protein n=1 Tax=Ureibacillus aquaedulcis TaxID=3058421 RepID=A0ABT8GRE6_9BACL|nr:hypothetical protein [Ureibacillus sp. BA0131]MDN4493986.1 hypothetical protein [Ureibacillus sp. BA0131]
MKKLTKISKVVLAASILGVSFVQSGHLAFADSSKGVNAHKEKIYSVAEQTNWDKSSLMFTKQNSTPDYISATIENGEDSRDMEGTVAYEVYWAPTGNPKTEK